MQDFFYFKSDPGSVGSWLRQTCSKCKSIMEFLFGLSSFLVIFDFIDFFGIFSYQSLQIVFHWSLCDSKSLQVSSTLLSILANLNNAVHRMVSTCSLISKSSSPFTNNLEIVPNTPFTNCISVTFMFHIFCSLLAKSKYLCLFFAFVYFYAVFRQDGKLHYLAGCFILLTIPRSGLLTGSRWSICYHRCCFSTRL